MAWKKYGTEEEDREWGLSSEKPELSKRSSASRAAKVRNPAMKDNVEGWLFSTAHTNTLTPPLGRSGIQVQDCFPATCPF